MARTLSEGRVVTFPFRLLRTISFHRHSCQVNSSTMTDLSSELRSVLLCIPRVRSMSLYTKATFVMIILQSVFLPSVLSISVPYKQPTAGCGSFSPVTPAALSWCRGNSRRFFAIVGWPNGRPLLVLISTSRSNCYRNYFVYSSSDFRYAV